jgi:hypothetical protein
MEDDGYESLESGEGEAASVLSSGSVSIARDWPGTRYQPAAQEPRSMVRQRSEQKGRKGLFSQVTGWRQIGQCNGAVTDHLLKTSFAEFQETVSRS